MVADEEIVTVRMEPVDSKPVADEVRVLSFRSNEKFTGALVAGIVKELPSLNIIFVLFKEDVVDLFSSGVVDEGCNC